MNKTIKIQVTLIGLVLLIVAIHKANGADIKLGQQGKDSRSFLELQTEVPSYGPPPSGYIYGGRYAQPFWYYQLYPLLPPPGYYPSTPPQTYSSPLIPAGRLILLVDPVSAEVMVDGLILTQRSDLSYEVGLLVGIHRIMVQEEGYGTYEEAIDIPGGQHVFRTIRLSPSQ